MSVVSFLPVQIIACQVLLDPLEELLPTYLKSQATYMDYALHRVPAKMTWELQNKIDEIDQRSLIVLGYGLCGNGTRGLKAGVHTLLLPRVHDCIPMMMGSRQAFEQEHHSEVGTYYLCRGWLEAAEQPVDPSYS